MSTGRSKGVYVALIFLYISGVRIEEPVMMLSNSRIRHLHSAFPTVIVESTGTCSDAPKGSSEHVFSIEHASACRERYTTNSRL